MHADWSGLPAYVELYCLSNFTFLRGASHPEELVRRAIMLGYRGLAITDECSLAGVVRAHAALKRCREAALARANAPADAGTAAQTSVRADDDWLGDFRDDFQLLIGSELRLSDPGGALALRLVALAQNREGYGNLSELITLARRRGDKGSYRLLPDDLAAPGDAHLRGLPDCLVLWVPEPGTPSARLRAQADWVVRTFGARGWLGLERLGRIDDDVHAERLADVAAASGLRQVAVGHVLMHVRSRKPMQDTLSAIRLGRPLAACGTALAPNAEQHLRQRVRLALLYPPDALRATLDVMAQCRFSLDELRYEYPEELVPAGHTPASYLRQEVDAGARRRYADDVPEKVRKQLDEELALIAELAYEPYFLTVYDIVRFAREQRILCQGRGSAANSAVCYCLGITEVDPKRSTLLFGRFLSRERAEPPDIDVDFEHQRREEVIQYIYKKYGQDRAALAATVITYRMRSALRDTGKALGIDASIIGQVVASQQWWDGCDSLLARMQSVGLSPDAPTVRHWVDLVEKLVGFPRHLSQHVGGFVIARDKLSRLVPIERAAMEGRWVIQWDKDDLESLRLLKVDVLALGMLTVLRRAFDMIEAWHGTPFDMQSIPPEEEATYAMIRRADTVGVFQIESRAQMSMLPRLRPRQFYDLVVQVAIVRPGPIEGGMVHPYLRRREGTETVEYPHEDIRDALERTLGIPIFQEQVMQIAMTAAGFSAGQADQLRRSMASWRHEGDLRKFQQQIIDGMLKNRYPLDFAQAICKQIEGFGAYGFPESHAASFAQLAYASAWLKRNKPAIFLCALLNSQPMGFYAPSQLVRDARRHGVKVRTADVMSSDVECTLETHMWRYGPAPQPAVRLGLAMIRNLRTDAMRAIVEARARAPFRDIDDLVARAGLSRQDLDALAAADALLSLLGSRREARWTVAAHVPGTSLLAAPALRDEVPPDALPPMPEEEQIAADYGSVGLSLRGHPLALLRPRLKAMRLQSVEELRGRVNGRHVRACGLVTMRQRPSTAKGMIFVSLEDETGSVNVILSPDLVERQRKELLNARLLAVYGVWQSRKNRVMHLVARRLVDLTPMLGNLDAPSRDFH